MNTPIKPLGCTNLKLRQLTRTITRHYDQQLASIGLKNTQYALLSHVLRLGPLRPGELAKAMQMEPSTLTRNMQPLVAHGWLSIGAGGDARSRAVLITEEGRLKQEEGSRAWQAAQEALHAQLGPERTLALHQLMDDCMATLGDSAELE
ncbi:MarR family winged helix-turn-helix transcriptional regulator [Pseudomonas entomophila]|uniref:MarR family winged helix-turn-helix transcriptional regulator n=1 Tax=Pseudomonas entomophila TaxID=312306 RepID=UPI0023D82CF8|nr:MarR family winged helix-turn-helix transcriptional regulator [Pseudomonas entomophila]MDF0731669.1 MarR family winged helix-turn-helix transcriptional regulator [Pseudomonas entomophila]